jgi:hypothetical protein
MKKVLFMLGIIGVLVSCQAKAAQGLIIVDTTPAYSLSYELQQDGSFKVDVSLTADLCKGTIDKVDGVEPRNILLGTLWDSCSSGKSPSDVISSLL